MVNSFVLASLFFSVELAGAWTTNPNVQFRSSCSSYSTTALDAAPSSALHYRRHDDHQGVVAEFPSSALFATVNRAGPSSVDNDVDGNDFDFQLEAALTVARDMDRMHGLCSPASTRAWQVVDELYLASSASVEVEANVKQVFGGEKSIWSIYERL